MRQRESLFSDKVKKFLDKLPNCYHFRYHGNLAGLPDRMGVINGKFFALELKSSSTAKRSELQNYILKQIRDAGGYAKFVHPNNWEETKKELLDAGKSS